MRPTSERKLVNADAYGADLGARGVGGDLHVDVLARRHLPGEGNVDVARLGVEDAVEQRLVDATAGIALDGDVHLSGDDVDLDHAAHGAGVERLDPGVALAMHVAR